MSDEKQEMKRKMPHSFPLTIRVGATDEVAFVDFANRNGDDLEAFSSVVLTKRVARNLIKQLSEFAGVEIVGNEEKSK
ncbi:Uncharacterised protein [Klebsiella pneumoniae]|uniref:hypothetical protein n=1 Tax=Enterobacteriaceae TaxID=543 RepID=UPI000DE5E55A|nr:MULTISPECIES: hypothetical protein [Enterobacteriaceae]SSW86628.1 Uncharacterised protein [Klebsiella pneumoniae]HCM9149592.1 hypothetical protein [Enterobacter roggenkampii]HDG7788030.1 hypothetical protein [Klebsiella quasipneumoniae]HDX8924203.1 hypothetical protein [Klebsiella michiganensis]MBD8862947.1 hypothetical protein [Klebsiella variicola]